MAETNAMDGSFRYKITLPNMTLYYNSRSLRQGFFGLGWCADFETQVLRRKNSYYLWDCQHSFPISITATKARKIKIPPRPSFQNVQFQVKNSQLISLQGGSQKFKFEYDKNLNLSAIHSHPNSSRHQVEMIQYDNQDRVIGHRHTHLCFDQFQYVKKAQNLYMTEVTRSCPSHAKENFQYVFSVRKSNIKVTPIFPTKLSSAP